MNARQNNAARVVPMDGEELSGSDVVAAARADVPRVLGSSSGAVVTAAWRRRNRKRAALLEIRVRNDAVLTLGDRMRLGVYAVRKGVEIELVGGK